MFGSIHAFGIYVDIMAIGWAVASLTFAHGFIRSFCQGIALAHIIVGIALLLPV